MALNLLPAAMREAIALYWGALKRLVGSLRASSFALVATLAMSRFAGSASAAAPVLPILPMQADATCGIPFIGETWSNLLPAIPAVLQIISVLGLVFLVKSFNPNKHAGSFGAWLGIIFLCVLAGFGWTDFWGQIASVTGTGDVPTALTCGMGGGGGA